MGINSPQLLLHPSWSSEVLNGRQTGRRAPPSTGVFHPEYLLHPGRPPDKTSWRRQSLDRPAGPAAPDPYCRRFATGNLATKAGGRSVQRCHTGRALSIAGAGPGSSDRLSRQLLSPRLSSPYLSSGPNGEPHVSRVGIKTPERRCIPAPSQLYSAVSSPRIGAALPHGHHYSQIQMGL